MPLRPRSTTGSCVTGARRNIAPPSSTTEARPEQKMTVIERMSGGHFLLLGRAGMDFYADPPGTAAEHASRFVAHLGGSSANVAVALARQGLRSALLTSVSDDAVGRFCVNQLRHYGVATDHVRVVTGDARTSLAVAESRLEDYRCVIYRNNAADFQMTVQQVEAVDFSAYDACALTGTALAAEPSRSAAFRAIELARQSAIPVVMDLDYRPYSWPSPDLAARTCARSSRCRQGSCAAGWRTGRWTSSSTTRRSTC